MTPSSSTSSMRLVASIVCFVLVLSASAGTAAAGSSEQPQLRMTFHESSLINEASSTMPMGVAFPVTIQLVDAKTGKPATTHSGTVISASISAPSSLLSSTSVATVQDGVATLMLTITSCAGGVITFRATDAAGTATPTVMALSSGMLDVQAVPNSDILFDAASGVQGASSGADAATTVVRGAALRAVKVNLYDSCGSLDTSMTGLTVTVSASSGVLGGQTTATFTNGVALFADLHFEDVAASSILTFRVGATPNTAAAHRELVSGAIRVVGSGDEASTTAAGGEGAVVISRTTLVLVAACGSVLAAAAALYVCLSRRGATGVKYVEVAASYV